MRRRQASLGRTFDPTGDVNNYLDHLCSGPDHNRFCDANERIDVLDGPVCGHRGGALHTAELAITDDGGQGAGGTFLGTVVFRNISNRICTVDGYPGLQRLDASGQPMVTSVQRIGPVPLLFSLQPQQQATFGYTTSDIPYGNATACAHATTVEVTPPDETTHVNVRSTLNECDPQGNVGVGALRPGKLNYSQYSTLKP